LVGPLQSAFDYLIQNVLMIPCGYSCHDPLLQYPTLSDVLDQQIALYLAAFLVDSLSVFSMRD
jgi:hypothetical protein